MKVSTNIFAGSLCLSFIAFVGCGKPNPSLLEGRWQITQQETEISSDVSETKTTQKVPPSTGYVYVFQQGQMYIPQNGSTATNPQDTSGAAGASYQAAYQVEGTDLILNANDGKQTKFEIKDLNEEKLTLRLEKSTDTRKEKYTLEFTRIGSVTPTQQTQPGQTPAPMPGTTPLPN